MDERFIYVPTQCPDGSSPVDEMDGDQCLFDDLPFQAYEKEEEVTDSVPTHVDAASQASYWYPDVKSEDAAATNALLDSYNTSSEKDTWTYTGDICYVRPPTETVSPYNRRRTSTVKKDRTPRTALKMMERHRENERTRHHNLNDSLSEICKKVPGSYHDGRETKVVMMQRIISYVAYLENTIVNLCSELGISHTNIHSLTPLTCQLRKEVEERSLYGEKGLFRQLANTKGTKYMTPHNKKTSRRLKLSSPTIDSTSDHQVPERTVTSTDRQDGSQDSMVPSSTFIPLINDNALSPWLISTQEEVIETSDFGPFFSQDTEDGDCLHLPSAFVDVSSPYRMSSRHYSHVVPDSLNLLSSPDQRENKENIATFNLGGNIMNISRIDRYGSERDTSFDPDMPDSIAVSPDTVLPTVQIPSSSSAFFSPVQSASLMYKPTPWTPANKKNKRKQYTPKRSPFSNISNMSESIEYKHLDDGEDFQRETSNYDDDYEDPEDISLQSLGLTRHQKAKIALLESQRYRPNSSQSEGSKDVMKTRKTDLRKASWMNGFMMFSRLKRRLFINANPGVHTSNISKIMGHTWRNMSPEQQYPYREKAKLYARELQKQQELPEEFSTSPSVSSTEQDNCSFLGTRSMSAGPYVGIKLEDSS